VEDLPRLWFDPHIEDRDRKRMLRLLIEDVTLMRGEQITLHVRGRGGVSEPVILDRPNKSWETWTTSREVVAEINGLLNSHTYPEIAALLNDRALRSGKGGTFGFEVLVCDRGGGPRRILGAVTEPHAVRRMLAALGLAAEPPPGPAVPAA
jgi:hypothetical protein